MVPPSGTSIYVANEQTIFKYSMSTGTTSVVAGSNTLGAVATTSTDGIGTAARFIYIYSARIARNGTYAIMQIICEVNSLRRVWLNTGSVESISTMGFGQNYQEGTGTKIASGFCQQLEINPTGSFAVFWDDGFGRLRKLDLTVFPITPSFIAGYNIRSIIDGIGDGACFGGSGPMAYSQDGATL
jgi:hypothetical protein